MEFTVSERWLHPAGIFPAQLVDFEETTGAYGPRAKWIFETNVEREDGQPPQLSYWTSPSLSEKSNLGKMLMALGVPIPSTKEDAAAFSPEALIGKVCRIKVEHDLASSGDGTEWANIKQFAPAKGPMPTAPAAANGNGNGAKAAAPAAPATAAKKPQAVAAAPAEAEEAPDPFESQM